MATTTLPGLWHGVRDGVAVGVEPAVAWGAEDDAVPRTVVVDERVVDELTGIAREDGLVLELVDRGSGPERRFRFYALHVQPALFGCCHVVRSWGRLGHRHRPRQLVTCHPTVESAHAALRPVVRRRLRRGYQPSDPGGP
jgi:predicted DNA-binding WGR domain protein